MMHEDGSTIHRFRTTQQSGFRTCSFASAASLDDLMRQLDDTGHCVVHLISVSAWNDTWRYYRKDAAVGYLRAEGLDWLCEPQEGMYASQRCLVCRL